VLKTLTPLALIINVLVIALQPTNFSLAIWENVVFSHKKPWLMTHVHKLCGFFRVTMYTMWYTACGIYCGIYYIQMAIWSH
jgi:hypothetical protein